MLDAKWAAYAKSWSHSKDARDALLARLVTDDVTYADPSSDLIGRDAFSDHIGQFQKGLPDVYFEITDVKGHHNRTLAQWTLRAKDGTEMMQGTSFASLTGDGKFASFSGFF